MANIYENAHVTLCATASAGDHGGCYSTTPSHRQPRKLSICKRDGIEYEVYIRCGLDEQDIPAWSDAVRGANPGRFPLMTRGWAYRRLVHFTRGELMWECSELADCECSQDEFGRGSTFMHHRSE